MKLGIAGCGTMGKILAEYAREEGTFSEIIMIEPAEENAWPEERLDLIIDFSHPRAVCGIYDYCRQQGGNIPVVLATILYTTEAVAPFTVAVAPFTVMLALYMPTSVGAPSKLV